MTIEQILKQPDKVIEKHIQLLAKDYEDKTGYKTCLSCKGDIRSMVSSMKNLYTMKNFEFKNPRIMYKLEKGSPEIISNERMTDEKAIKFLTINPERIELFRTYPENWKELVGLGANEGDLTASKEDETQTPAPTPKAAAKGCKGCKDKAVTTSKKRVTRRKKATK